MSETKGTPGKKETERLKLRRETLRELDDTQLEQVAGGKHRDNHTRGRCGSRGVVTCAC